MSLGVRPVHPYRAFIAPAQTVSKPVNDRVADGVFCSWRYQPFVIISQDFFKLLPGFGLGFSARFPGNPFALCGVSDRYLTSPSFPLVIPVQAPFAASP